MPLAGFLSQSIPCLLWPTQYLTICSNASYFALNPFLAYWQPNTSVQVNNMSVLHRIHMDTHIYITSILLFILVFTLLPLLLAGQLPLTLPIRHINGIDEIIKIGSPVLGICSGWYIDPTKLILVIIKCWTGFTDFKESVHFNKNKKYQKLNSKERASNWYHFWPTLFFVGLYL